MASENIVILSDADFDQKVLKSSQPVLVDFWADWCGPCKAIAPFLDQLANEYKGKVTIAKLNVDENTKYAAQFGVRSIPTLILFKGGEQKDLVIGADSGKIKRLVDSAV